MSVKPLAIQRKLQIVLKLLAEKKAILSCIYVKAVQNCLMIHYVTRVKRHWSNRLWDTISSYNDNICSQCGHDHSHKVTGSSAIQDMISFLDRDISSES
jgi:hypothetical protein